LLESNKHKNKFIHTHPVVFLYITQMKYTIQHHTLMSCYTVLHV